MDELEVLRELARKTGLPETAGEAVLQGLRELARDGAIDPQEILSPEGHELPFPLHPQPPTIDPKDPSLVEQLIDRARKHPLGLEFLLSGLLASVAIALGAHAFTVEAARARLRREQAAQAATEEMTNA